MTGQRVWKLIKDLGRRAGLPSSTRMRAGSGRGATVRTTLGACNQANPPQDCRRVKRVVIGMMDPDGRGQGYDALQDAGLEVELFPPAPIAEIEELNREYRRSRRGTIASASQN